MSQLVRPINPELLAAKIESIENFEYPNLLEEFASEPRLVRALWHLQFVSMSANYAGGLGKFAGDLIAASCDTIGTAAMVEARACERYSLATARQVYAQLSYNARESLVGRNVELFDEAFRRGKNTPPAEWCELLVKALTPERARACCVERAESDLAEYFLRLCEQKHVGFKRSEESSSDGAPWYFAAISDAVLAFIESTAAKTRAEYAETQVTQLISQWIVKSRKMRGAVMITGNTRIGKTESLKLNARMNPGLCRLVNTPDSGSLSDLLREVARCLGLDVKPGIASSNIRERIDYVLRFAHLQLLFDESQMLYPAVFSRNTAPARLNWVGRAVIDRDVAAVFVATPQSYLPAKKRFVKTTGFAMEQFDGRLLDVRLPDELSEADLLAVARLHLRDVVFSDEHLRLIVDELIASERNFFSDIKRIAILALASWNLELEKSDNSRVKLQHQY